MAKPGARPEARAQQGRHAALQPLGGATPACTLIPGSWPPELSEKTFLLSQGPSLWLFITAALGHPYKAGVQQALF